MAGVHLNKDAAHGAVDHMKTSADGVKNLKASLDAINGAAPGLMVMDGSDDASWQIIQDYNASAPKIGDNLKATAGNADVIAKNMDTTVKNQEIVDANAAARYRRLGH